ncbi:MAG: zf-HC2 domain-containing protein [Rudaea sp.]
MIRISCQHASRLLSQREDEPLSFGKRLRLRLHLLICDACTNVSHQFAALRKAMQRFGRGD